jgi:AraC-like DNA-binding protein
MDAEKTEVQESRLGRWEMVLRRPRTSLRGYVQRYQGYTETAGGSPLSRHFPSGKVALIISFGSGFRVTGPVGLADVSQHRNSFVAGLHDTYSDSEWLGESNGIQVDFTPIGAHLFFGLPMHTLTNRVIEVEDILGPEALVLREQLAEAPAWPQRFAVLDSFVASRFAAAGEPSPEVAWAWRQIAGSGGRVPVGLLADEIGWSRKHLIARFREQVGLPPKTVARIVRFSRTAQALEQNGAGDWAGIALDGGYYDQSHLIREFHEFAGSTPSEFLERRRPPEAHI